MKTQLLRRECHRERAQVGGSRTPGWVGQAKLECGVLTELSASMDSVGTGTLLLGKCEKSTEGPNSPHLLTEQCEGQTEKGLDRRQDVTRTRPALHVGGGGFLIRNPHRDTPNPAFW